MIEKRELFADKLRNKMGVNPCYDDSVEVERHGRAKHGPRPPTFDYG